jgi:hypothetical protein
VRRIGSGLRHLPACVGVNEIFADFVHPDCAPSV